MEQIDLISDGYKWICLNCEMHNYEAEITDTVICFECDREFKVNWTGRVYS